MVARVTAALWWRYQLLMGMCRGGVQFVQLRDGLGCGCGTDLQPGNTGQIQRLTEVDGRSALSFQDIQEIGHLMFKR
jgi:hypothetical protein